MAQPNAGTLIAKGGASKPLCNENHRSENGPISHTFEGVQHFRLLDGRLLDHFCPARR